MVGCEGLVSPHRIAGGAFSLGDRSHVGHAIRKAFRRRPPMVRSHGIQSGHAHGVIITTRKSPSLTRNWPIFSGKIATPAAPSSSSWRAFLASVSCCIPSCCTPFMWRGSSPMRLVSASLAVARACRTISTWGDLPRLRLLFVAEQLLRKQIQVVLPDRPVVPAGIDMPDVRDLLFFQGGVEATCWPSSADPCRRRRATAGGVAWSRRRGRRRDWPADRAPPEEKPPTQANVSRCFRPIAATGRRPSTAPPGPDARGRPSPSSATRHRE